MPTSSDIKRIDTDGVRSVLDIGQLGVDNFSSDKGRVYTGNGVVNKAFAFLDDLPSTKFYVSTSNDLGNIPVSENSIVWLEDLNRYAYYDITVSKWMLFAVSNPVIVPGYGDGQAGTFLEDWESGNINPNIWKSETIVYDSGNSTSSGKWNRHNSNTPSGGTGKTAHNGYYIYAECSSNGHTTDFKLETSNFAKLTQLKFWYNLNGSNCGDFSVEYFNIDTWTEIWVVNGSQGDDWHEVTIDTSSYQLSKIRFRYRNATGYQADLLIDDIEFTSTN